jgi:hypothetical protein
MDGKQMIDAPAKDKTSRDARLHPPRYTFQLGQQAGQTLRKIRRARHLAWQPAK